MDITYYIRWVVGDDRQKFGRSSTMVTKTMTMGATKYIMGYNIIFILLNYVVRVFWYSWI